MVGGGGHPQHFLQTGRSVVDCPPLVFFLVSTFSAGDPVNTAQVEFKIHGFRQNADEILDMVESIAIVIF